MTTNEKNKRLAELLGVSPVCYGYYASSDGGESCRCTFDTKREAAGWLAAGAPITRGCTIHADERFPNYCHDLNAVHEVEIGLTDEQCQRHYDNLADAADAWLLLQGGDPILNAHAMYSATAEQRVDALIATLEEQGEPPASH